MNEEDQAKMMAKSTLGKKAKSSKVNRLSAREDRVIEKALGFTSEKPRPNFYGKVYALVEQIPFGKVTTYGSIAQTIGMKGSSRMVGQALTAMPETEGFPAHRVINRFGALTGAIHFGGYDRMRKLLEREGVTFLGELVDMEKHFWHPRSLEELG
jgi:methylated-DNA-protein-cysteine methyltransferase related protein